MLSRRTPQNVLGTSQQQTSARQTSSLSTNILQLHNGTLPQGVTIKLTDDCFQNLQKAAQNGYDVLVHVNQKSITIEIKTSTGSSLKFDCYFQRVNGNTIHALCKTNNTFTDVANIAIRAQVKPTEQTFQTSRQKAANLSKHLELESNKCRTQMLSAPITKPGERLSFKNKPIVNRVGIPKSIPYPRNGSSSLGSSSLNSSTSSSNLLSINSNKLAPNIQRGPQDYAALKQQVLHYIACGRFKSQDEIVDHILSTGLPPAIPPESAKRKIREIICEVAEVYVNPPKISLLPKYHREINIDWEHYSVEDRERVRQALSQTELTAGNNFAPMRQSKRGALVAPRAKSRKDPATPAMSNSTTTSPDIASDASTCSTPSPVNQMQIDNNDYPVLKPEKRKMSSSEMSKPMSSLSDDFPPPSKKRLTSNESSNVPSSSKEVQFVTTNPSPKSIPKSSSQSDFQKMRPSPSFKPVSSPKPQQNGYKNIEKIEKLPKEHLKPKEYPYPINKNQLYNGFTKAEEKAVPGNKFLKKFDQSNSTINNKSSTQEHVSKKSEEREKSKATSEPKNDLLCEKTKELMEFAEESVKKMKEKEKKKEKVKAENQKIAEEKVDKRDKNVENVTKLDIVNNGITTVEKKIKIEIKIEKQPKEKNEEKTEKEKHRKHHHHHHHHHKEKSSDKKDGKNSELFSTSTTTPKDASSKLLKEAVKESSKKNKSVEQIKEKHSSSSSSTSSSNGKMISEKEIKNGSMETSKKDKKEKKDKEEKKEKKEFRPYKSEAETKTFKEMKPKNDVVPISTKPNNNKIFVEKSKEKEQNKEKEKEKTLKAIKQESKITPTKDAASLASERLLIKPAEKLSKPIKRDVKAEEFVKPLIPEKSTSNDIKKVKIKDLLKSLSDPLKPSKSYESKYPPIRSQADAEVYAQHELEYYDLYEKAYNHILTVQKDLSIYVERLNKAESDQEKQKLEEKIRNYAARCLQDTNFRTQRLTVANMTKAIQVLRQRQDEYYGSE